MMTVESGGRRMTQSDSQIAISHHKLERLLSRDIWNTVACLLRQSRTPDVDYLITGSAISLAKCRRYHPSDG